MPKIMYRPNPVPPPFVPPVPSYDTKVHFIVDPYPYENGDSVDSTFEMFNLPNHYTWEIGMEPGSPLIEPSRESQLIPNQPIPCVTENVIESDWELHLFLYDEELQLIYECQANCDNF